LAGNDGMEETIEKIKEEESAILGDTFQLQMPK
jgi:hypothetical protein